MSFGIAGLLSNNWQVPGLVVERLTAMPVTACWLTVIMGATPADTVTVPAITTLLDINWRAGYGSYGSIRR